MVVLRRFGIDRKAMTGLLLLVLLCNAEAVQVHRRITMEAKLRHSEVVYLFYFLVLVLVSVFVSVLFFVVCIRTKYSLEIVSCIC